MLYLRENIPSIHTGESTAIVFASGVNQGYVKALDAIMALANSVDAKKQTEEDLVNKGLEQ